MNVFFRVPMNHYKLYVGFALLRHFQVEDFSTCSSIVPLVRSIATWRKRERILRIKHIFWFSFWSHSMSLRFRVFRCSYVTDWSWYLQAKVHSISFHCEIEEVSKESSSAFISYSVKTFVLESSSRWKNEKMKSCCVDKKTSFRRCFFMKNTAGV